MMAQAVFAYENKDAPRLTEHERLREAEREFEYLAGLAERADVVAREYSGCDRLKPDCNWRVLWDDLGRPYESPEAFKAAMRLAPAAKWKEFLEIHRSEVSCFRELLKLVREAKGKRGSFGMKFLAEELRWRTDPGVGTPEDDEPFTVNNNYTAYYARLIALFDPTLQEILEFRQRTRGK